MKNKKIWSIGLCGAICLSIAGVTYASYASALASDTPKVSTSETGNTSGTDILYQDTDGGQISVDGKNWVAEADYEKNNTVPDVQWWTADEYEAWMNEQKKEMESLIGTGDGWYDGQGVFHEFTQESVDAMMDSYNITKQLGYNLQGLWILDGVVYRLPARQFKPKQYTIVCIGNAVLCSVHFHDFANNIKP